MKKGFKILLALMLALSASFGIAGCGGGDGTVDVESVDIIFDQTTVTPGDYELLANVLPKNADKGVSFSIGAGAPTTVSVVKIGEIPHLRVAANAADGATFQLLCRSTFDPTISDSITLTISNEEAVGKVMVSLSSNVSSATLSGAGQYDVGASATVVAPEISGYTFLGWFSGGTKVSDNRSYTFVVAASGHTLEARYEAVAAGKVVVSLSSNVSGATLSGAGQYDVGASVTVTTTEISGHTFLGWFENGSKVADNLSYTFTVSVARSLEARYQAATDGVIDIANEAQLRAILTDPNGLQNKYRLTANITLTSLWPGIGVAEEVDDLDVIIKPAQPFVGQFNGNGYTISGFDMTGTGWNRGFFNQIGAAGVVENLGLVGVLGANAWSASLAGINYGTIRNCFSDVAVNGLGAPLGALVGSNKPGASIINCLAIGVVTSEDLTVHSTGFVCVNDGTITNSFVLSTSVLRGIGFIHSAVPDLPALLKTDAELKMSSTFVGWDTSIWNIVDGAYPSLKPQA